MEIQCDFEYDSYNNDNFNFFGKFQQQNQNNLILKDQTSPTTTAFTKFKPQQETETLLKGQTSSYIQTKQQCITFMQEYAEMSLEELRIEDYAANLKDPQARNTFEPFEEQQSNNNSALFKFGSVQQAKPHPTSIFGSIFSNNSSPITTTSHLNEAIAACSNSFQGAEPMNIQMATTSNSNPFGQTSAFYNFDTAPNHFKAQPKTLTDAVFSFGQLNTRVTTPFETSSKPELCESTQVLNDEKVFTCIVVDQIIPEDQELKFIGQHKDGKSNDDVIFVKFNSCTVTKVPQGLTKIFPNMIVLMITNSKLKNISKDDLIEYKNLKAFRQKTRLNT
ncbi:hypothetical protein ACKWTF_015220 [Chironomus riparius]